MLRKLKSSIGDEYSYLSKLHEPCRRCWNLFLLNSMLWDSDWNLIWQVHLKSFNIYFEPFNFQYLFILVQYLFWNVSLLVHNIEKLVRKNSWMGNFISWRWLKLYAQVRLDSILDHITDILGSTSISIEDMTDVVIRNDFDSDKSVNSLLNRQTKKAVATPAASG